MGNLGGNLRHHESCVPSRKSALLLAIRKWAMRCNIRGGNNTSYELPCYAHLEGGHRKNATLLCRLVPESNVIKRGLFTFGCKGNCYSNPYFGGIFTQWMEHQTKTSNSRNQWTDASRILLVQVDSLAGPPQCIPKNIAQLQDAKAAYQEGRDPIVENGRDLWSGRERNLQEWCKRNP